MTTGQKRMQRKIQQFQSKPNGNIKLIQRQIEADQKSIYKQGLDFSKKLEPFKKWSMLMSRQIATMRLQFYYQLKEFDQVDQILASRGFLRGPLMMEPLTIAMKMARQYKNKDIEGAEKTFNWYIKWFKGDRGALLYGLMSWIFVKTGEFEKAREILAKAKDSTTNDIFAQNWEKLSNNKPRTFSNAGLGDEWYGLYLENPPTPKQKRMRGNPNKARMF
jgi:tetratricopeptide (TPR) repeat protein